VVSVDTRITGTVAAVLKDVRSKGVTLWVENGQLHFKGPKGALTRDDVERLRTSKERIVALFENAGGSEIGLHRIKRRPDASPVPLAFSQLSHWYQYRLYQRCSVRQIAAATRLRGRLDLKSLRESIAEMMRRHEALRARVVLRDGVPVQEIADAAVCELTMQDVSEIPQSYREDEVTRLIQEYILEPVDVAVDSLVGVRLLRLGAEEHVLVVAMEHLISDMVSLNLLLRDLFTAYAQVRQGRPFSLPPITVQFPDYAAWQRKHESTWMRRHGPYWGERFAMQDRTRFPEDEPGRTTSTRRGWGTIPLRLPQEVKAQLRGWSQARGTTLVMGVFTAYVALLLRWCNVPQGVVRYQVDGRVDAAIANTVGYFALPLFLRIALGRDDTFELLTRRVIDEYCFAYEHADYCYHEAMEARPEFTRTSAFNWLPSHAAEGPSELDVLDDPLIVSPVPFAHPMIKILEWDAEPAIVLAEVADEIAGGLHFPLSRFTFEGMERFARNFVMLVETLLKHPQQRVNDVALT
jgi:hypothetical protein